MNDWIAKIENRNQTINLDGGEGGAGCGELGDLGALCGVLVLWVFAARLLGDLL